MKKKVSAIILSFGLLLASSASAEDPVAYKVHPLATFVHDSASSDKVSVVDSSAMKRRTKVFLGAAGGAALGFLHAKLTGGDVAKETLIGAAAGGMITYAVTKIQDKRLASREDVMKMVSYDPAQGYRAGVREVTVSPSYVHPGGTITVVTTYWALSPVASVKFGMARFAGIAFGASGNSYLRGFTFNPQPFEFSDGGGQYQTTMEIHLPPSAPPGEYNVQWVVDGQSTSGDSYAMFTVAG